MQVWLEFSLVLRKALLVTGSHALWGAVFSSSLQPFSDTICNASVVSKEGVGAAVSLLGISPTKTSCPLLTAQNRSDIDMKNVHTQKQKSRN